MNFWTKDNVIQVHCELSTFCNAACPKCPRFIEGTPVLRPGLELEQITLEKFKKYFDQEFIKKSTQWLFCGTHGDPMMAKDVVKIIEYLYELNPDLQVKINTNGGIRKEEDWKRLGELSKNTTYENKFTITFSIDGLEDTNHLYRRNVEWSTLMRNVKAFIGAGGKAVWDFLIFKHNQHQVQQAENLSIEMGFRNFIPKRALGFEYEGEVTDVAVFNDQGEYLYSIESPDDPELVNFIPDQAKTFRKKPTISNVIWYKKNRDYLKDTHLTEMRQWDGVKFLGDDIDYTNYNNKNITCKSSVVSMFQKKQIQGKEIFVNASGIVGPCCYIGTQFDVTYRTKEVLQLQKKISSFGVENFDLNKHTLTEILESGNLNKLYAESWDRKDNDRMLFCAYTCGQDNPIDRIWKDRRDDGRDDEQRFG